MTVATRRSVLRRGERADRVTNVELFFDLVYVFAVTQLSHSLLAHVGLDGAIQTAVLLAMVWQLWVYTTWAVNYLDPDQAPTRVMLLLAMAASLVLAAALPGAFTDHGLLVAVTYVVVQVGRACYAIVVLRGENLRYTYLRILPWSACSGAVVLGGAAVHGHAREALWALAIAVDLGGAALGFFVPGLGRSDTTDWTISGAHFAERCQAFVLIALGESVIVIGSLLRLGGTGLRDVIGFAVAFATAVGLWWIYFDRAAAASSRLIEQSPDPGRLARSAYHWVHPLIVAGVIVSAAGDERVLAAPEAHEPASTAWLVLGGVALFLGGHALFKALVWRSVSWPRVGGVVAALALLPLGGHVAANVVGVCALAIVAAVALADGLVLRAADLAGAQDTDAAGPASAAADRA